MKYRYVVTFLDGSTDEGLVSFPARVTLKEDAIIAGFPDNTFAIYPTRNVKHFHIFENE